MDVVLIIIHVPLMDKQYEIKVSVGKKIGSIKKLLIQGINSIDDGILSGVQEIFLYNKQSGTLLNENSTVLESGIENGTELVLI